MFLILLEANRIVWIMRSTWYFIAPVERCVACGRLKNKSVNSSKRTKDYAQSDVERDIGNCLLWS